jgi:hypothetical protein
MQVEHGIDRDAVVSDSYDSIRQDIITSLEMLRDTPAREEVCNIASAHIIVISA